ncbi:MAG: D-glycerate dehydrogenase [bacterium]|nr:D-glycerate dehydrogenase [bacterium]
MKIFVTRKIPFWDAEIKPLVDAGHELVVRTENSAISAAEMKAELAKGYDGLLTLLTDKITADILAGDTNKQLKIIANYAVGFDNIDVAACKERNIWVTNAPSDAVNESVAEMAWTLMLALTRRLNEASEFMHNAAYTGWEPGIFMGSDMKGKTLGIVGMGRIGSMVAKRAQGFEMKVMYHSHKPMEGNEFEYKANLEDLLKQADYITLHVPLTPETTHLINGKNLPLFKKGAFLVNTARGPVVNEAEVAEALRAGMLAGYGADVLENEPHPQAELLQMENVILTPHIASATTTARRDMTKIAIGNLVTALAGTAPANMLQ